MSSSSNIWGGVSSGFQASDPDGGDAGQLVYSLAADSPYLDVEPSSGLVYVVSVLGLSSGLIEVQVKVTDPAGLTSVTTVEVRRREPGTF